MIHIINPLPEKSTPKDENVMILGLIVPRARNIDEELNLWFYKMLDHWKWFKVYVWPMPVIWFQESRKRGVFNDGEREVGQVEDM